MDASFNSFFNSYIQSWKNSSLGDMQEIISQNYQAREISAGKIIDFGYEDSIRGWQQGFKFVKENNGEWKLNIHSIFPLRENEVLAIVSAELIINKQPLETGSLFFQTFSNDFGWRLIRSYIETGISIEKLADVRYN